MRRSRFFVAPENVDQTNQSISITDFNQVRQILTVLRLRVGDKIDLLDGKGQIYSCEISSSTGSKGKIRKDDQIVCAIKSAEKAGGESSVKITIALPVLRNTRFEWALEKLTELGVSQVVPIILDRSVVTYDGEETLSATKFERWKSIVKESSEQSERALIPNVVAPIKFADYVKSPSLASTTKFIGAERADAQPLIDAADNTNGCENICIAIGAEGGFTEEEFALSFAHGFAPISLGKRILRAETAALYAASVLVSRLDK